MLLDDPEAIADVHRMYLEAGAHCITTAGYQVSFPGFEAVGLSAEQCREALLLSVELATAARDHFVRRRDATDEPSPLVAASVGPYGAYLADGSEYDGRYGVYRAELAEFHRERLHLLATSGADLLACETIPSLEEAEVILELLDEVEGAPAWLSFTCGGRRARSRTARRSLMRCDSAQPIRGSSASA